MESTGEERDHGPQPLDALLAAWQLGNHDLVDASTEQLTHKQVQKARKGRQLTLHTMHKVSRAFNLAIWRRLDAARRERYFEYQPKHLFAYAKGHDPAWQDPNAGLIAERRARAGG
jgi:hypothetical protein